MHGCARRREGDDGEGADGVGRGRGCRSKVQRGEEKVELRQWAETAKTLVAQILDLIG